MFELAIEKKKMLLKKKNEVFMVLVVRGLKFFLDKTHLETPEVHWKNATLLYFPSMSDAFDVLEGVEVMQFYTLYLY